MVPLFVVLLLFLFLPSGSSAQEPVSYYILSQELKVLLATGEETKLSEIPRYTIVITREEIDRIGARNLFDLLDKLPEFYVWRSFFGLRAVGALGIRQSYFSEKVQVLIDGMPTFDPSNGSSFSTNNNFSLDGVKQVEIVLGPMTSLYGFNSSLAVINLVTYSPDDVSLSVKGYLSSEKDGDFSLVKSFSKGEFKGVLSFNYNEWRTPEGTYTDFVGYTGDYSPYSKHTSFYLKLNHSSGLYLKSYFVDRDDVFPVSISGFVSEGEHSYADRRAFLNELGYKGDFGEWDYSFSLGLNFFFLERGYNLCPMNHLGCRLFPYGFYAVEKRNSREPSLSFELRRTTSFGKFLLGVDYSELDLYKYSLAATFSPPELFSVVEAVEAALSSGVPIDPTAIVKMISNFPMKELSEREYLMSETERRIFSPYVQYFYSKGKNHFIFNARWHKTNDVGNVLSSSVSYMRDLSRKLNFKLNFGRAVRMPSFEEMYIKNNSILTGNPDLKVEKEDSIIPSLEYKGDTFYFSGFFYLFWFRDFIYKKQVSPLTHAWANSDSVVKVRGAVFSLKKKLADSWELGLSFNRRFSVSGLSTEYLNYPRDKAVVSLSYFRGPLTANLSTVAYSSTSSSAGFYYSDFTLIYSLSRNFSIDFQVRNLTDKSFTYPGGVPGGERSIWLGVRYSY